MYRDLMDNLFNTGFTKSEVERIGNAIIYITERLGALPKTKVLKLLYFLEEKSVIDSGSPFFGLKWKVWKLGPVDQTIFNELSNQPDLLKSYIKTTLSDNSTMVSPAKKFDDSEFSDYDLSLMDKVISSLGYHTAGYLSDLTHKKGGLWDTVVRERGLKESFENGLQTVSDYDIDFSNLLIGDEQKSQMFQSFFDLKSADRKYS